MAIEPGRVPPKRPSSPTEEEPAKKGSLGSHEMTEITHTTPSLSHLVAKANLGVRGKIGLAYRAGGIKYVLHYIFTRPLFFLFEGPEYQTLPDTEDLKDLSFGFISLILRHLSRSSCAFYLENGL